MHLYLYFYKPHFDFENLWLSNLYLESFSPTIFHFIYLVFNLEPIIYIHFQSYSVLLLNNLTHSEYVFFFKNLWACSIAKMVASFLPRPGVGFFLWAKIKVGFSLP